ncbi:unnamed protein product [Spodoptera exigua]|nr:unnamed protein product [Spodoptera exigua]
MDADNCISRNTSKKRLLESDSDLELDCCSDSDCSIPKKCLKKMNTKQTKRRQKYKSLWEKEHGAWLTNDPQNEYNAKCKLCGVIFAIASAGIGQGKQHLQTKQHKSKSEMKKSSGLLEKFIGPASASTSSQGSFYSDKDNVTAAELALTYHTVKHNLSYNSMDCTVKLNKIIYVNSSTATSIRLARTKMEAIVTEVLGPYALQNICRLRSAAGALARRNVHPGPRLESRARADRSCGAPSKGGTKHGATALVSAPRSAGAPRGAAAQWREIVAARERESLHRRALN